MQLVEQGGSVNLTITFKDNAGITFDPSNAHLDLLDPTFAMYANDLTPSRNEYGVYDYSFAVPADALTGTWTARWSGATSGGATYTYSTPFEVYGVGQVAALAGALGSLRLLIADSGPEQMFSDDQLMGMLTRNSNHLTAAVAEGWLAKAGKYAGLIDHTESGTDRKLSQMYRQANQQATLWASRAATETAGRTTAARVPGKTLAYARTPYPIEGDYTGTTFYFTEMNNRG